MKKRILSMILATAMVATMLVGCGAKQEAAAPAASDADNGRPCEWSLPYVREYEWCVPDRQWHG